MLKNSVKKLDFFGIDVKWNYGGANKHKTVVGFIISVLFFGMGFYTTYQIGASLVKQAAPEVTKSTFYDSDPNPIDISGKTIGFAIGLQEPVDWYHFLDETIYTLDVIYTETRRQLDSNTNKEVVKTTHMDLPLANCSEVPDNHVSKLDGIALQNLSCFANPDQNLQLQGVWESPVYKTIDFRFKSCINTTENGNHCKSPEIITKFLKGSWVSMHFADQQIDVENLEEPGQYFRGTYFAILDPLTPKYIHMYLKNIEIQTDTGILMEELRVQKYAQFQAAYETFSSLPLAEAEFLWLRVKVGKDRDFYKRRYDKLFSVLPKLFSLLKSYLIILVFVINPLQRFQFYRKFIGECCAIDSQSFKLALSSENEGKNSKKKECQKNIENKEGQKSIDNDRRNDSIPQLKVQSRDLKNVQNPQSQSTQAFKGVQGSPSQFSDAIQQANDSMTGLQQLNNTLGNNGLRDQSFQQELKVISFSEPGTPRSEESELPEVENQLGNDNLQSGFQQRAFINLPPNRKSSFAKVVQNQDQQTIFTLQGDILQNQSLDMEQAGNISQQIQQSKELEAMGYEQKKSEKEDFTSQCIQRPVQGEDIKNEPSEMSIQNPNESSQVFQENCQEQRSNITNKFQGKVKKVLNTMKKLKSNIIEKSMKKSKFQVGFSGIREEKISTPKNQSSQKSINTQTLERIRKQYFPEDMRSCEISISEFILSQFGSKLAQESSKKKMLYEAGKACIEETLDVKKFFLLKNEVELFKVLLLSPEELELFESIANEKINIANHLKIKH